MNPRTYWLSFSPSGSTAVWSSTLPRVVCGGGGAFSRDLQAVVRAVRVDVAVFHQAVGVARRGRFIATLPGETFQTRAAPTHTAAARSVVTYAVDAVTFCQHTHKRHAKVAFEADGRLRPVEHASPSSQCSPCLDGSEQMWQATPSKGDWQLQDPFPRIPSKHCKKTTINALR